MSHHITLPPAWRRVVEAEALMREALLSRSVAWVLTYAPSRPAARKEEWPDNQAR
jgi:hypothetical protein